MRYAYWKLGLALLLKAAAIQAEAGEPLEEHEPCLRPPAAERSEEYEGEDHEVEWPPCLLKKKEEGE